MADDRIKRLMEEAQHRVNERKAAQDEGAKAAEDSELLDFRKIVESRLIPLLKAELKPAYGRAGNTYHAATFKYEGKEYCLYRDPVYGDGDWVLEVGQGQTPPGKHESIPDSNEPINFSDDFLVALKKLAHG